MTRRAGLIWTAFALCIAVPLWVATQSPQLQWREPIYIVGGFAGIIGLALLLVQAVLIAGVLPVAQPRRIHLWTGAGLVGAVVVHVAGLWLTSPPDVIDVLLFRSPTPFGVWGAVAMWAVFTAAGLAALRPRLHHSVWRLGHSIAVILIVIGTVVHAWLIQGSMGTITKAGLCALVLVALVWALRQRRVWRLLR